MQIDFKQTLKMPWKTRNYRGIKDLALIADLINLCDRFDDLDDGVSVTELQNELESPSVDQDKDLCLWEDANGNLIAYGDLWISEPSEDREIDGALSYYIDPEMRGKNLEADIFEWAEARMLQVKRERECAVKLRAGARDTQTEKIELLEKFGLKCDRYFFRMERSLLEPIESPQFPSGLSLTHMHPETDKVAWLEMLNEVFLDHWNHHPVTLEVLEHWQQDSNYQPELDLIAVTEDGSFAGFCFCNILPEYIERIGKKVGFIEILGTRRNFRRTGLGKAMLLAGLQKLKDSGMEIVRLGVDAENPSGALRLYESVGFTKQVIRMAFYKEV